MQKVCSRTNNQDGDRSKKTCTARLARGPHTWCQCLRRASRLERVDQLRPSSVSIQQPSDRDGRASAVPKHTSGQSHEEKS